MASAELKQTRQLIQSLHQNGELHAQLLQKIQTDQMLRRSLLNSLQTRSEVLFPHRPPIRVPNSWAHSSRGRLVEVKGIREIHEAFAAFERRDSDSESSTNATAWLRKHQALVSFVVEATYVKSSDTRSIYAFDGLGKMIFKSSSGSQGATLTRTVNKKLNKHLDKAAWHLRRRIEDAKKLGVITKARVYACTEFGLRAFADVIDFNELRYVPMRGLGGFDSLDAFFEYLDALAEQARNEPHLIEMTRLKTLTI